MGFFFEFQGAVAFIAMRCCLSLDQNMSYGLLRGNLSIHIFMEDFMRPKRLKRLISDYV